MATFLLKTEPSDYSFERLEKEKRARWDGVTNPAAQLHLRSVKAGDRLVIYHTGSEKRAVGLAEAVSDAYPLPGSGKLWVFDLEPHGRLESPVPLASIKQHAAFADSTLVKMGRLSVVPLTPEQWSALTRLAKGGL